MVFIGDLERMAGFQVMTKVHEDIGIAKTGERFPTHMADVGDRGADRANLGRKFQERKSWASAIDANLELASVPCAV
jgi:hypothetical protein